MSHEKSFCAYYSQHRHLAVVLPAGGSQRSCLQRPWSQSSTGPRPDKRNNKQIHIGVAHRGCQNEMCEGEAVKKQSAMRRVRREAERKDARLAS